MKRGQVTVFIIIAVILVVAGGSAYYISMVNRQSKISQEFFSQPGIKADVDMLRDSIVNCMDSSAKESLEIIGIQGGYYTAPENKFDLGWAFIPYYYDVGKSYFPSKTAIESELGKAVDESMGLCLDSITLENYDLSHKLSRTKVLIKGEEAEFSIDMPVTIKREEKRIVIELEEFPVTIKSDLNKMYEVADFITSSHKEDPEMLCVSCAVDMAEERELFVDMIDFEDETTVLVIISSNDSSGYPAVYEFLNRYPVFEEPSIIAPAGVE